MQLRLAGGASHRAYFVSGAFPPHTRYVEAERRAGHMLRAFSVIARRHSVVRKRPALAPLAGRARWSSLHSGNMSL